MNCKNGRHIYKLQDTPQGWKWICECGHIASYSPDKGSLMKENAELKAKIEVLLKEIENLKKN